MLDGPRTDSVDKLLDELEAQAGSSSPNSDFFRQALLKLNFLLDADGSAIVVPAQTGSWLVLATGGRVDVDEIRRLCSDLNQFATVAERSGGAEAVSQSPRMQRGMGNHFWIGAPLRSDSWGRGGLLVSLAVEPPQAAMLGLGELVSAMAEIIAVRQVRDLEKLIGDRWMRLQRATELISVADSKPEAACILVNELLAIVGVDRVTLVENLACRKPQCLSVSGVEIVDHKSAAVADIVRFAGTAVTNGSVVVHRETDSPPPETADQPAAIFPNALAIPFSSPRPSSSKRRGNSPARDAIQRFDSVVVLEWDAREKFFESAPLLHRVLPAFEQAWRAQRRWSRVPKFFWAFAESPSGMVAWFSWRAVRWTVAALIVGGLFTAAQTPQELRIEASGTLEPAQQRAIFASADGYIDQLPVEDGAQVQVGQLVAVIRSPEMSLRKQEYEGELLTLTEKRSGLQIAINQLSPDDPSLIVTQSRLSAEIRELDARAENVRKLAAVLDAESKKLELRSPIRGVVVANELRRNLQSRPVRRGDALMRVVALDGAWRLELEVPDRDSAYVIRACGSEPGQSNPKASGRSVAFVLTADPKRRFAGAVQWISNASRNPRGTGAFVDVHVSVSRDVAQRGHAGSTVLAYFSCGQHPWWFIWSRPLVEAIQRRMWF